MSILVVGSIAYDTIETPRWRGSRLLGGSASYFTLAASGFAPTRVVGVVGEDFPPEHLELLSRHGADIAGIQRRPGLTFHWSGRYHDDLIERDTLATELGVFADFQPVIPVEWRSTPYVFLANIQPRLQQHVLDQMAGPRLVVLDTMNLWIETARQELLEVLARVDVLLVNDSEARLLTGQHGLARAAAAIRAMGPERVVVKKGEHGAWLFGRNTILAVPGLPLDEVRDPTGAGDTFAGGFVGSLASAGADRAAGDVPFRRAMLEGTVLASFCPEGYGIEGLLRHDKPEQASRLARLRAMMIP